MLGLKGIKHEITIRYTPQQNGVLERAQRSIVSKVRCMLRDAACSKRMWAEAANTAVYLLNRSPHKAVKGRLPEQVFCGKANKRLDFSNLRVFGCKAEVKIPSQYLKKLDDR